MKFRSRPPTVGLLQLCKFERKYAFLSFISLKCLKFEIFYDLMHELNGISDDDFLLSIFIT